MVFIHGIAKININIAINLHLPVECCAGACVTANYGRGSCWDNGNEEKVDAMGQCIDIELWFPNRALRHTGMSQNFTFLRITQWYVLTLHNYYWHNYLIDRMIAYFFWLNRAVKCYWEAKGTMYHEMLRNLNLEPSWELELGRFASQRQAKLDWKAGR